jgi:hypothetical protein
LSILAMSRRKALCRHFTASIGPGIKHTPENKLELSHNKHM